MSKTATITIRVEPELKQSVEAVLKKLGMTTTQAITTFLNQINLRQGLPFEVKIPNKETQEAIARSYKSENLTSFDTVEELYEDLGI